MIRNVIDIMIGGFDNGRTPHVQQYDIESREYECRLWKAQGKPYQLNPDAIVGVVFRWRRNPGSKEYETKIENSSTVVVRVPKEAMEMDGFVLMQLKIHDGEELLNGPEIAFAVRRSIKPGDKETDEPVVLLVALVGQTQEMLTAIRTALENGDFNGKDGFSPEVKLTRVEGGVRIDVVNKNTTYSEMIHDAKNDESGNISEEELAKAIEDYFAENPVEAVQTINGEEPDENGNLIINALNDAEIAGLSAVLI